MPIDSPQTIEDILVPMHKGQWFGWSDSKNKVYANLVIHDDQYDKPTEAFLNSKLAEAQGEFDAADYARKRVGEYPSIGDQLDMQYHDNLDNTTTWKDAIAAVKTKYEKPS